ncbi:MAG: hypothetical protein ACXVY3_03735, partial [Gaiellaceae bacterium]
GEGIEAPDAALTLIARSARGSFRDAVSTLDQLAAATEGKLTVPAVLQLLGAVEEETLFRLCDLVVESDAAGALSFVEELSEQGQDLARLVGDLLEHLRHLMLAQHLGEVPESLPVTQETRERLLEQAGRLPPATVVRLCDLLAVAVDDMRQGGDPRLPLELALVKVARPAADLSREALAHRLELLEQRAPGGPPPPAAPPPKPKPKKQVAATDEPETEEPAADEPAEPAAVQPAQPPTGGGPLELGHLQEAWQRSILPAIASIPTRSLFQEAHPVALEGSQLRIEFPRSASFHRNLAEDERNLEQLQEALYQVTGARFRLELVLGDGQSEGEAEQPEVSEEQLVSLFKDTFDARELDE